MNGAFRQVIQVNAEYSESSPFMQFIPFYILNTFSLVHIDVSVSLSHGYWHLQMHMKAPWGQCGRQSSAVCVLPRQRWRPAETRHSLLILKHLGCHQPRCLKVTQGDAASISNFCLLIDSPGARIRKNWLVCWDEENLSVLASHNILDISKFNVMLIEWWLRK